MKGFIPVDDPHAFGDKSNDWLVARVVPMFIGFGWLLKPNAPLYWLLPLADAGNMAVPKGAAGAAALDEGDEPKLAHGRTG